MRLSAPLKKAALQSVCTWFSIAMLSAIVGLLGSSLAFAQPYGYSVNSRGNLPNSNDVNALWRINLADGTATRISDQGLPTGFLDLEALAMNADEALFGADDDLKTLVRVSMVTGVASAVGGQTINMGRALGKSMDFGMTFTCEGEALVVSDVEQSLFSANTTTGQLTLMGEAGALGVAITDLAANGDEIYGIGVGLDANGQPVAPNLYRIDVNAVSAELIGALGDEASPYNNAGLSFDETGQLWAMTDRRQVGGQDLPSEILKIDTETGRATRVATSIVGLESLAIGPPPNCGRDGVVNSLPGIPIPAMSPWALVLLMLLAASFGRRFLIRGARP